MYYELSIRIASSEKLVFIRGFESVFETADSPIHSHPFTEVHVILEGRVDFRFDGSGKSVTAGGIVAIPPGTRHSVTKHKNRSIVFGLQENIGKIFVTQKPVELVREFENQMNETRESGNFSALCAYISLFCAPLFPYENVKARECADHSFIIDDYFDTHYADARLSELASILGFSEKQTARLVAKYTGKPFKKELRSRRVIAAKKLSEEGELSLSKIAETVGYTSYSSLWKAMKK